MAIPDEKTAAAIAASVGFSVFLGVAFFPTRPHLVVFVAAGWLLFQGILFRRGQSPLAVNAAVVFWLLVAAEKLNFGYAGGRNVLAHMAGMMVFFAVVAVLYMRLPGRAAIAALVLAAAGSAVLSAIAGLYVWHATVLGTPVSPDVFNAVYQTNLAEAAEFLVAFADLRYFAAGAAALALFTALAVAQWKIGVRQSGWREQGMLFLAPLAVFAVFGPHARVLRHVGESAASYRNELAVFRELRDRRLAGTADVRASKRGSGETYVLVIGESLNRNHMRLYGYHRNTTPRLVSLHEAGEILKFESAYSTHTHTMLTLPHALTAANQRNGSEFLQAPSLIDVSRAAGFETHWVTNQLLYGAWDNAVSILAHGADSLTPLNRYIGETAATTQYDEATITELVAILARETPRNRLIVVHLMGSHLLYCKRYPRSFERFAGDLPRGEFGRRRTERITRFVNCYDNSVLYNDSVVAGLVRTVRDAGGVKALVYFSDHAQDALGGAGHNSARFNFSMVEIPMLAWFSDGYKTTYPGRVTALASRGDAIFPTDFLYDTVLGIMGVETPHYDPQADLSGQQYRVSDIRPGLMHGTRGFLDAENVRYHQRQNIAQLAEMGLARRIAPHRVNSTGMLAQVLYDGFRALELDVLFRSGAGGGRFIVGHDQEHESGNFLSDVLAVTPQDSMAMIWLDVKNLDAGNVKAMKSRMLALDSTFGLKRKTIFESPSADQLRPFADEGFHTSFYLPTELLLRLSRAAPEDSLRVHARAIAQQVANSGVQAVSFDHRLYDFVKRQLEPLLPRNVVYHTWELDLSLADPAFIEQLRRSARYQDPRVRTILVSYTSELAL